MGSGPEQAIRMMRKLKTKLLDCGLEEMGMFSLRKNRQRGK